MDLNYHHLKYFWSVAREGGVGRAAERLNISQPTVSAQVHALEEALGEKLFSRSGRRLVLTDVGRVVLRYADEIFGLGRELLDTIKDRPTGRPTRFTVGIANVVPKPIAHRLLEPALSGAGPIRLECVEDRPDRLLAELASHALDLVLADAPVGAGASVRAYSHPLGETPVAVYAAPALARACSGPFPRCLDGAAFLVPTQASALRRELERWFEERELRLHVAGEFEDQALLEVFGQSGLGLFASPLAIERDVVQRFGVTRLGVLDGVVERFYALSVERRLKHPAVVAISREARSTLFS
jgi:LysR family transcriptional activator of nhaA